MTLRHLIALALLAALPAAAKLVPPGDLKEAEVEIEVRTRLLLSDFLDPVKEARDMGLEPPVYPPAKTKEEVEEIINTMIEQRVEAEYPKSMLDAARDRFEQHFRRYKPGERVTVFARVRGPNYVRVTGTIVRINPEHVQLSTNQIPVLDLHPRELPHFYPDENREAVVKAMRIYRRRWDEKRNGFRNEITPKLSRTLWREYGYVQMRRSRRWIPREEYFSQRYDHIWQKSYEKFRPEVQSIVYNERGWQALPSGQVAFQGTVELAATNQDDPMDDVRRSHEFLNRLKEFFRSIKDQPIEIEPERPEEDDELFQEGPADTPAVLMPDASDIENEIFQ